MSSYVRRVSCQFSSFGLAKTIWQKTFAGVASEDFNEWVRERGAGSEHAPFFEGDFKDAVAAAASSEGRTGGRGLLLLWLHETDDENTNHLCREVWPHPGVVSELSTRFIAWAGDTCRSEASSIARLLRVRRYPALVAIQSVEPGTNASIEWPQGVYWRILWHAIPRDAADIPAHQAQGLHAKLVEIAEGEDRARHQEAERRDGRQQTGAGGTEMTQEEQRRQARRARREKKKREDEERSSFAATYESKFGIAPPELYDAGFDFALAAARAQRRLLLVWLFASEPLDDQLCSEVFNCENQVFRAFVSEYFIMWPGDAKRWYIPSQLFEMLRLPALPALCILQPLSIFDANILPWADASTGAAVEFPTDSAWCMLGSYDVTTRGTNEAQIMAFLAEHGESAMEIERLRQTELQQNRLAAEEARLLREQQDWELEESMRMDNERAAAGYAAGYAAGHAADHRGDSAAAASQPSVQSTDTDAAIAAAAAADAARKAEAAQAAQAASKAAHAAQIAEMKAALAASRRVAAEKLLDVPAPSGDRCELVLRLPNGRRVARTFGADEPLTVAYAWAHCSGELAGLQGAEAFDVPRKFTLATTYPRQVLREEENVGRSLRELGLCPNAVVALSPDADEDD